jgi:hypothetical protein
MEIVSLLLRAVSEFARKSNLTQEQLEEAFRRELTEFTQNDPDDLPDV